jgi:hypothetical protein
MAETFSELHENVAQRASFQLAQFAPRKHRSNEIRVLFHDGFAEPLLQNRHTHWQDDLGHRGQESEHHGLCATEEIWPNQLVKLW